MKLLVLLIFISVNLNAKEIVQKIPTNDLENMQGQKVNVFKMSHEDNILFLNFWAHWCSSCKKEIPELNNIMKRYSSRKDIKFIAIHGGDEDVKIKRFLKRYPFSFEILKDKDNLFSKEFGVDSLPQTFIIKQGKVLFHKFFPPTETELTTILGEK